MGTMLRRAAWPSRPIVDAFAGAARDATVQQTHDLLHRLGCGQSVHPLTWQQC
jgi:hypothetical protein